MTTRKKAARNPRRTATRVMFDAARRAEAPTRDQQNEIDDLRAQIDDLRAQRGGLEAEMEHARSRILESESYAVIADRQVSAYHDGNATLQAKIAAQRAETARQREELAAARYDLQTAKIDNAELQKSVADQAGEIVRLRAALAMHVRRETLRLQSAATDEAEAQA